MLLSFALLASLLLVGKASAAPAAAPLVLGDCTLHISKSLLTAEGLTTPLMVSGLGCQQANMTTFAQGVIFDTATSKFSVYNPLVIDAGTKPIVPLVPLPALPATAVVGIWFGTNGMTLTLTGPGSKGCVNGVTGSVFGQFAACNADNFFAAVNAAIAAGTVTVPPAGTALDGLPCPSVRDFAVIDMDQSDNVITSYWLLTNGSIVQDTAANRALFPNGTESDNGSDNRLWTNFMAPAFGCMPWQAPDLANNNAMVFALPFNEIQAAANQANPAIVPADDPMVLNNGNEDLIKLNSYRISVNQPNATTLADASTTTYCQNIISIGLPRLLQNQQRLTNFTSPMADAGNNLWTFLAQRSSATLSSGGLNCVSLLNITNPWNLTMDGNGVTIAATLTLPTTGTTTTTTTAATTTTTAAQPTTNGNLASLAMSVVSDLVTAGNAELAASQALSNFVSALSGAGNNNGKNNANNNGNSNSATASTTAATQSCTNVASTSTAATSTAATTSSSTAAATSTAASTATSAANPNIVVTLGADPGQNGGQGINDIQCNQGQLTTTINLLASVNVNNIHAYQPMAELGLPTIAMSFFVGGQPGAVSVQNTFNVADSAASGNVWTFTLQDDGPHPGGQLTVGTCTPGAALPQITASFATNSNIVGQGLPNGADGGPPVPAVSGIPTLVNALPAQFNNGVSAVATTANAAAAKTTTKAAATATSTAAGAPNFTFSGNTNVMCNNGMLSGELQMSISELFNGVPSGPMAERGLPTVDIAFLVNNQPVTITANNVFNGGQPSAQGSVFTFTMLNDQGNVGGAFTFGPCAANTKYTITSSISSTTNLAPLFNGIPVFTNQLTFTVQ